MDLERLSEVEERIKAACTRAGRERSEVTLVAVSKAHAKASIQRAYDAGLRDFGENRASEMAEKAETLPADIRWHFVGSLQSNKVRLIRNRTHLLHSVDRRSLAKAWAKGIGEPPPVLIQVDVGDEEQKGGVQPGEASEIAELCLQLGLRVDGVMSIPPLGEDPEESRPYFGALRRVGESLGTELGASMQISMGMTNDYEVAIEEGASLIRVGRAIFGERHKQE